MIAITARSSTRVKPTREATVEQRGPERWGRDEGDMVQAFGNALTKRPGTPPEKRVQGFCEDRDYAATGIALHQEREVAPSLSRSSCSLDLGLGVTSSEPATLRLNSKTTTERRRLR